MAHLRASATEEELVEAVQATAEDTASDLAELAADEAQTLQAIAILQAGGKGAYKQALALVREDTGRVVAGGGRQPSRAQCSRPQLAITPRSYPVAQDPQTA